jgi:hypothetical protein
VAEDPFNSKIYSFMVPVFLQRVSATIRTRCLEQVWYKSRKLSYFFLIQLETDVVNALKGGSSHAMRNELCIWLKELHRLVQCSRFFLGRDQKYLCLMEAGESGRRLSSRITDELKLVAHRVGSCPLWGETACFRYRRRAEK